MNLSLSTRFVVLPQYLTVLPHITYRDAAVLRTEKAPHMTAFGVSQHQCQLSVAPYYLRRKEKKFLSTGYHLDYLMVIKHTFHPSYRVKVLIF